MIYVTLVLATLLAIVDQIIKYFVLLNVKPVGTVSIIENFFVLTYLENTGVAFGLLENLRWIYFPLTVLGCCALIFMLFRYKQHTFWSYSAITLLLAGGVGNLVDRINLGYVIDYFHFEYFSYVFNFADCCVTVGAVFCAIAIFTSTSDKHKETENETPSESELEHVNE